ncbi:MAG: sugar phosphate isomerase/epimerase [Lentisphaerae bacterium]|jgi:sugar phosphate isomerase/epimerase|nr:sugar phosphate isomerase/epimerase [Lentisphaerota bacterium]
MFKVPVTFLFDFEHTTDAMRPYIMHEFAANGAKHLVLTDTLISMVMQNPGLSSQLQKEVASFGLTFVDAHAPFGPALDLICPDPALRRVGALRRKLAFNIAVDLGVDTIAVHVGNDSRVLNKSIERSMELIVSALDDALAEAEKLNIVICIENIWFRSNTPERLLEIKAKFPTEYLGFCYDSGHANLMDKGRHYPDSSPRAAWNAVGIAEPPWENQTLEKMLPHIVNCHLHDNDGSSDQHRNIGHGNIDWKHIIGLLKTAPRLKNIQSEVIPLRTGEPIREVCEAFQRLGAL